MSEEGATTGGVRLSWNVAPRNVTGRSRDNARVLRRYQTPAEALLWDALRGRKVAGLKFRRQVPVGRCIVDFLCFEAGLVIEADGSQHADIHVHEYDDVRTSYLKAQGLIVLRFTNDEIESNLPIVIDRISAVAQSRLSSSDLVAGEDLADEERRASPPSPLPRGRGAGGEAITLPIPMPNPGTHLPNHQESEPDPCASS